MTRHDRGLVKHALRLADSIWGGGPRKAAARPATTAPRAWFVLQTMMHGEKDAAKHLGDVGFATYLPMMKKEVLSRRARATVVREFLLFNRYLFAELPSDTMRWPAMRHEDGFHRVLGNNGRPSPISEQKVRAFMTAQERGDFDVTKRLREAQALKVFPVGRRIRAVAGPFGGFSGQVVSASGVGTIKAMIELFGGMTPVEFPIDMVEPD